MLIMWIVFSIQGSHTKHWQIHTVTIAQLPAWNSPMGWAWTFTPLGRTGLQYEEMRPGGRAAGRGTCILKNLQIFIFLQTVFLFLWRFHFIPAPMVWSMCFHLDFWTFLKFLTRRAGLRRRGQLRSMRRGARIFESVRNAEKANYRHRAESHSIRQTKLYGAG